MAGEVVVGGVCILAILSEQQWYKQVWLNNSDTNKCDLIKMI